jgi:hypothetical protein
MLKIITVLLIVTLINIRCSNNSTDDVTDIPTFVLPSVVKYKADVEPIINNFCVDCHKVGGAANFLPLVNRMDVKNAIEKNNLIERINSSSNPMPAKGLIEKNKREIIEKWKTDGYQE